jgi:6-phosphogluconolactonase
MRVTRPIVLLFAFASILALSACSSSKSNICPSLSAACPCTGPCVAPSYVFASAPATLAAYPLSSGTLGTAVNRSGAAFFSFRILASPVASYLYQPDILSRSVLAYSINNSTGELTPVAGSPFSMGSSSLGAVDIAITPDGTKLYASDFNGSIITFSINGTGALTPLMSSTPFLEGLPHAVVLENTGKLLYASDPADRVLGFALNADGSLSALPGLPYLLPAGSHPEGVTLDAAGKFLYVTLAGMESVAAFSLNATTGALTAVGSPAAAGNTPEAIAVNPGGFVYAINAADNNISAYKINTDGSLMAVAGSPFPTGAPVNPNLLAPFPGSVATDRASQYVWVGAPSSNTVTAFRIDGATGALTSLGVTSLPVNTPPGQVAVTFYQQ